MLLELCRRKISYWLLHYVPYKRPAFHASESAIPGQRDLFPAADS